MRSKYTVLLRTIAEEHGLQVLHASRDYETKKIVTYDVNRPAMQLAGFYNYFDPARIQIIGRVESTYLDTLSDAERLAAFERFMQFDIAALVICHGVQPFPECMEMAEKYDRTVFITPEDTSEFQAGVISSLRRHLAPRTTVHGVLVEIYGEGVLLTGDSGIGKSETALELIKRGHRLIADDAVEIKKIGRDSLVGDAPEMIRYYMELRGIGVVNVRPITWSCAASAWSTSAASTASAPSSPRAASTSSCTSSPGRRARPTTGSVSRARTRPSSAWRSRV